MPDSKIVSCTATADARQQNQMLSRKTFAGFYEIVRETCIFSTPLVSLIDRGLFEKTSKTFHPPRVGGTACAEESAMVHHYCPRT